MLAHKSYKYELQRNAKSAESKILQVRTAAERKISESKILQVRTGAERKIILRFAASPQVHAARVRTSTARRVLHSLASGR